MKPLPCPFCGSSDVGVYRRSVVQCRKCLAYGPFTLDGQEIDLWNTRTGTVYNGKTAEEWYRLYCESLIRGKPLAVLAADSLAPPCPPPSEAPEV